MNTLPALDARPGTRHAGRCGSTHTEYVLIAAVVSVSLIVAVLAIGGSLSDILTAISEVLGVF